MEEHLNLQALYSRYETTTWLMVISFTSWYSSFLVHMSCSTTALPVSAVLQPLTYRYLLVVFPKQCGLLSFSSLPEMFFLLIVLKMEIRTLMVNTHRAFIKKESRFTMPCPLNLSKKLHTCAANALLFLQDRWLL